ncbi:MAG: hypothetical protein AAFV88_12030 [Planctomycetota bacterium]
MINPTLPLNPRGRLLICALAWLGSLLMTAGTFAADSAAESAPNTPHTIRTVKRGLTAEFQFSHPIGTLQALGDQSIDAPALVRLEKLIPLEKPSRLEKPSNALDSQDQKDTKGHRYALWFFGAVVGDYRLADYVVQSDGSPLVDSGELSKLTVRVVSDLPPDRGTNLYEIEDPALRLRGGYRAMLVTFSLFWISVPLAWAIHRRLNRTTPVVELPIRKPTLADQIRPLVQRAYDGTLSVQEQSRLELSLYKFWQHRVGLPQSLSIAIPMLRQHPEAGELLRTYEACVHAPEDSRPELDTDVLDQLLAPYRTVEATAASMTDAPMGQHDIVMESAS